MRHLAAALALALAISPSLSQAQAIQRSPLPVGHPLIGTWRVELPQVDCHETYDLHADGTTHVTSAQEVSESEFEISAAPSENGFYRWVDRIVHDNGKPDCLGSVAEVGHVSTNYILLNPAGTMFLMCAEEAIDTCIGPFVRQEGI